MPIAQSTFALLASGHKSVVSLKTWLLFRAIIMSAAPAYERDVIGYGEKPPKVSACLGAAAGLLTLPRRCCRAGDVAGQRLGGRPVCPELRGGRRELRAPRGRGVGEPPLRDCRRAGLPGRAPRQHGVAVRRPAHLPLARCRLLSDRLGVCGVAGTTTARAPVSGACTAPSPSARCR